MSLLQQEGGRGVRILPNQDAQRLARILDNKQRTIGVRMSADIHRFRIQMFTSCIHGAQGCCLSHCTSSLARTPPALHSSVVCINQTKLAWQLINN